MRKESFALDHNHHSVGVATVHLCWISCRRKRILKGAVKDRLYAILAGVALDQKWQILAVTIELDHRHLFVRHQPHDSIAQIANAFKGRSITATETRVS